MRFGDDTNPQRYSYDDLHTLPISIERFITHNENWSISRKEDDIFTVFYLHGIEAVSDADLKRLQSFDSFVDIIYRDNCLCIRVLNKGIELDGEALEIAKTITHPRVEIDPLKRWRHMQKLKAEILSTFEQYEEGRIADFEALQGILCDTFDLTTVIPASPVCWLEL